MASETLIEKLSYTKAYRQTRLDVANWVLARPETFPELLDHCFNSNTEISYKAAWILEYVCFEKLELLYPHFDTFFKNLPNVRRNQALRPMAKICELITIYYYKQNNPLTRDTLTSAYKEVMINCCFDWLITNQKVACEVYSMGALCNLGVEIKWIHPELKTIIESNMHARTAAYKARSRHVLAQITKFQNL